MARSGSAGGGTLARNERRMLSVVTDAQAHDELRKDLGQMRVRVQADAGCRLEATGTKPRRPPSSGSVRPDQAVAQVDV
jgi:hypothetical protein